MKRAVASLALAAVALVPVTTSPAWASGGSGGGGGSTSGGTTSGGGGGGGGGGGKTCTPTIAVTATASKVPGERSLTASYSTQCASKTRVTIAAVNTATGATEWNAPVDSTLSSYTWNAPLFGTTYRIDAKLSSNTGPLLASTSTTVTTLAAPADCGPTLGFTAGAGATAADYGITGTYSLVWCGGGSSVLMTATNTSTGAVEWSSYFGALTSLTWATPRFGTSYRLDVTAYDSLSGAVLATATRNVTTIDTPPNCATITGENITTGYWLTYAALWISTQAKDCGYGGTSVHLKVTNLTSGAVEYETYGLPLSSMVDFEGPVVKYDTPYQIDVDVRGVSNEILDASSQTVQSPPMK